MLYKSFAWPKRIVFESFDLLSSSKNPIQSNRIFRTDGTSVSFVINGIRRIVVGFVKSDCFNNAYKYNVHNCFFSWSNDMSHLDEPNYFLMWIWKPLEKWTFNKQRYSFDRAALLPQINYARWLSTFERNWTKWFVFLPIWLPPSAWRERISWKSIFRFVWIILTKRPPKTWFILFHINESVHGNVYIWFDFINISTRPHIVPVYIIHPHPICRSAFGHAVCTCVRRVLSEW